MSTVGIVREEQVSPEAQNPPWEIKQDRNVGWWYVVQQCVRRSGPVVKEAFLEEGE